MTTDNEKQLKKMKVRMPPSPTGYMHIGTVRMALFNYLYASQHDGQIVMRMEDTDRERSKKEFADDIIDGLRWLGLGWDEGPYYQSQRGEIYKRYLQRLLDENKAYWCFCSQDELEAQKQYQMSRGEAPIYSGKCFEMPRAQAEELIRQGRKAVVRFRGSKKKIAFNDIVRGRIEFDCSLTGDFVIAKDLDNALYNFTVVVDDCEMGITHVIRGEDHISNTPKQILVQEALGIEMPVYAHLPIVMGADRSKLSKRHGAVAITEYRRQGYLAEALINFTAFLGWNPGTEKEIYSMEELLRDFSLDKVQKGGAVFNPVRLDYLNGLYIRQKTPAQLAELCLPYFIEAGLVSKEGQDYKNRQTAEIIEPGFLEKIVAYQQPRLKKLSEIVDLSGYFFTGQLDYDKDLLKWKDATLKEIADALDELINLFSKIETGDWGRQKLEEIVMSRIAGFNLAQGKPEKDRGYLLWPLRVALCGQKMSIGPFEMADVLGREKTLKRLMAAKDLASGTSSAETLFDN
ncbi:MAG: glutamate--tRNA ligase [Candidatus Pacebacteria bacterium]|nr:glutamate--tRNA ligase [Candidatus Paceibacterota bacterium]